jgi:hypothetical protein
MRPGPTHADVVVPFVGDRLAALEVLDNIMDKTEIPCRIIFCDDGNGKDVMEGVRIFANENPKVPMVVIRNDQPLGWAQTVARSRLHVYPMHEFFAVLAPGYLIESAQWFGHMIAPLQRDPVCYASLANPNVAWNSMPPVRLVNGRTINVQRAFAMFKRKSNPPIPESNEQFGADLFRAAASTGNTVWEVPSVRLKPSSGVRFTFATLPKLELDKRLSSNPVVVINR